MRSETYEPPALGEYVHDPRAVPARLGTNFSDVLASIGSTEGRVHPHVAYALAQGNIALDHQRFVEASGGGQGELTI
jgi:hypothetical protein